jgi:hypothetical protein
MGILTLYGTNKNIKKIPLHTWEYSLCIEQNKNMRKIPTCFHKQLYLHGIFPSIDRKTQINRGILKFNT